VAIGCQLVGDDIARRGLDVACHVRDMKENSRRAAVVGLDETETSFKEPDDAAAFPTRHRRLPR
jgi:hypothetical protein